jgi:hypothetical protein
MFMFLNLQISASDFLELQKPAASISWIQLLVVKSKSIPAAAVATPTSSVVYCHCFISNNDNR